MYDTFVLLVAGLAIVYAGASKFLQEKLIDRKQMEELQGESKRLSDEYNKAQKSGDKKRMETAMQEQMAFLPKMNTMMFAQFKPMIIVLLVFFAFIWIVGQIDPNVKDDFTLTLADNGLNCDKLAGDGIYSACYKLNNSNFGKWVVAAKALDGTNELAHNSTYFTYEQNSQSKPTVDPYLESPKGEPMPISTDKQSYATNEIVSIYTTPPKNAKEVVATFDDGTAFRVDLPLTIPIVNIKTIWQPYWWFVLISLISNILISIVFAQLKKKKKASEIEGEGTKPEATA